MSAQFPTFTKQDRDLLRLEYMDRGGEAVSIHEDTLLAVNAQRVASGVNMSTVVEKDRVHRSGIPVGHHVRLTSADECRPAVDPGGRGWSGGKSLSRLPSGTASGGFGLDKDLPPDLCCHHEFDGRVRLIPEPMLYQVFPCRQTYVSSDCRSQMSLSIMVRVPASMPDHRRRSSRAPRHIPGAARAPHATDGWSWARSS